jgi:hypothetical protein
MKGDARQYKRDRAFRPVIGGQNPRIHAGFRKRTNARPAQLRRPAASTGGQIARQGAFGEMQKVVASQDLRRDGRIIVLSAVGNGRNKSCRPVRPASPSMRLAF